MTSALYNINREPSSGGLLTEDHPVRVLGQRAPSVQHKIFGFAEPDLVLTHQSQPAVASHLVDQLWRRGDIDGVGLLADEAQYDSRGAAVTVASGTKRAEQFGLDPSSSSEQAPSVSNPAANVRAARIGPTV
jgi:hypothetical protein